MFHFFSPQTRSFVRSSFDSKVYNKCLLSLYGLTDGSLASFLISGIFVVFSLLRESFCRMEECVCIYMCECVFGAIVLSIFSNLYMLYVCMCGRAFTKHFCTRLSNIISENNAFKHTVMNKCKRMHQRN